MRFGQLNYQQLQRQAEKAIIPGCRLRPKIHERNQQVKFVCRKKLTYDG